MARVVSNAFAGLGRLSLAVLEVTGGLVVLLARVLRRVAPRRWTWGDLVRELYHIGISSLPILVLVSIFVGAIMVIQTGPIVVKSGVRSVVGWGTATAVFSELGPVLIGIIFAGRVGANSAAELGSMRVTGQVDALVALAMDPLSVLVVPRFIAMTVMLSLLTVIADVFALVGGALTAYVLLDIGYDLFFSAIFDGGLLPDILKGLVKSAVFGMSIAVIACYFGLRVRESAQEVGQAVNGAVVTAAISIFVLDFLLTIAWGTSL